MVIQKTKYILEEINHGEMPTGYKKTKAGIIPNDWEIASIKNLVERISKPVEVDQNVKYRQIGIRSHGKGIFYKHEVSGLELGNKTIFWIEPDCFIVNIVFAWEMAVARTTSAEDGMVASHRFPMYKPIKEKIDVDYLTYFFKSDYGKNLLELSSPGGAGRNKTLGQKEFMEMRIPIPSKVSEQHKIVDILSAWDDAVELKGKLLDQKKQQKRKTMQILLSGKIRLPGFEKEWLEKPFEECFISISVKKNQINSNEYKARGKYPIVDQGKRKIIGYSDDAEKLFECPELGVIVFGDHTRELKYIDFNFIVGADGVQVLGTKENYDVKYLYYQLQTKKIPNTGYNRHFKFLRETSFQVPEIDEQIAISKVLWVADKEIDLLEQEIEAYRLQKRGLMQLLLTGKVRVKCNQ